MTRAFADSIEQLQKTLLARVTANPRTSYAASLYSNGIGAMCEKIREESDELIAAAHAGVEHEIVHESADLIFHLTALLVHCQIPIDTIGDELSKRQGVSGFAEKQQRLHNKE